MNQHIAPEYDNELLDYLQLFRGEGFLSPGGAEETRRVLERVTIAGKQVLEVGSGLGGCCVIIATERGAKHVHGVDVEAIVIERARAKVARDGLDSQITFQQIEPGPLPLASNTYDVVFSKDAMCHIEDKALLYSELFRVLKPNGQLAVGDWLVSQDGPHSQGMRTFIETTGLSLHMDSLEGIKIKLESAGFVDVEVVNRNAWFRDEARNEAELLEGPLADQVVSLRGKDATESSNACQQHMITVLDSGEFCPSHFFARKP